MKNNPTPVMPVPQARQAVCAECFPPSGGFAKFPKEDVETSIPDRFERISRRYPERIAVKAGAGSVTYAELNVMANRVARAILARQSSETKPVGLLLEKDASLMAAMLGVLKAGQFFMLLDVSFPRARNVALIEDAQAELVITDRANISLARELVGGSDCVMEFDSLAMRTSADNLGLCIAPEAFAAIVYTSGSTGEPKGVVWNHRDLLHRTMLRTIENQACKHDRIALLPVGTANAVTNSFLALLNGAMLCPFAMQKEGVILLAKWLSQEGITICPFSSSLFRSFTAGLTGKETFPALRIVRLRSETVHRSDFELFKRHFPSHCAFVTGLSCSEAGQLTTFRLSHNSDLPELRVPIGYPMQDKEILLLDDAGNEVGCDRVGEIVVRSRYLAVGYWNRRDLTEAKFRVDPNGSDSRICFTGDLAVRLPDGCLVHKGRKDFRVKIRGYGVELAEVERRLLEHSGIEQAAVLAQEGNASDARLAAYYTGVGSAPPRGDELREFLAKTLPQYMIPATFVLLDEMPLTANGKVDRRALPVLSEARPDLPTAYVAARNDIEGTLVSIWEDVLDVHPVGVNDGFFDLGGDSLSANRVISRIIHYFELEIPLQSLFQSSTIAEMAPLIARRQGRLVDNHQAVHGAAATLIHESPEEGLPLSYSQQRLWFLDQLDPGSSTYNLFSAYRLKGDINVAALEQSFNEIVRRHEVLRTVFKLCDGKPVQVILPSLAVKIPLVDLRALASEEDRWSEARRIFTQEAQRPFDLTAGPLLRITLLQLADDEYLLLRTMHHIVSDGWSEGVLFHELSEIYAALCTGQPSPLTELPAQYADYARWQREWFVGERLESQLSYWRKQLDNIGAPNLPTDRPKQALQARRGARGYFALSDALSSDLKKLSRQYGATLFMTLLAAYQTLLHRYSHQTDVAIGSPIAGRNRKELEELIGFFLNMLVLRLDLSGNPTFIETMARVREVCLGALSHQELPFEKLVEEMHPDRNLGQNPLFQVTFAFQNTPRVPPRLSGLKVEELEVETGIARFDLHLFMEEINGHLQGYCDYDSNLFEAETIERMVGHFKTLLEAIVANPKRRISELPLLSEGERHQLLVEWNDTQREYPKDKCVHQLFEEQVEKTPDAVAVVFEDQQLTYRELNSRANQLAHYLRELGVGPEVLVGICMERSLEMIVGLLGILKAGGAYVSLDPSYPQERLAVMLVDSRAAVLITHSSLIDRLPAPNATVVCLDRDGGEISTQSQDNSLSLTTPDNLAYVIYTSGSTGNPKGVGIQHVSVVNFLASMARQPGLSETDILLAVSTLSFDMAGLDIYLPLTVGARLVLVRREVAADGVRLAKQLSDGGATVMQATPAMWRMLLAGGWQGSRELKILCGGESLAEDLAEQLAQRGASLWNMYGPTETTIYSAVQRVAEIVGKVTLGRAIANTELYILDSNVQPVPIGVVGELHIGGDGLARGYLNRPERTAEKFIANPFSDQPGARLYKSGDLARYLPDGSIEFFGRIDHQVKIRGFRIELGEIEATLAQHRSIKESVVLARDDNSGGRRLVAYAVAASASVPSVNELRSYLQQKLPDYMLPSAFVFLDSLPLTPNGKLDRTAFPDPGQSRPELAETYCPPQTRVEELLAQIWAEVLKLDQVGIHDNFFALGGDSLRGIQIIARLRNILNKELFLSDIFSNGTIADLAKSLTQRTTKAVELSAESIHSTGRHRRLPLSFSQERVWFIQKLYPSNLAYHFQSLLYFTGLLDVDSLERSLGEIVRRHEIYRTTFPEIDGNPIQDIHSSWPVSLPVLNLEEMLDHEREAVLQQRITEETRTPFDFNKLPLVRWTLVQLKREKFVLIHVEHHLVHDGWSFNVFRRELLDIYKAFSAGDASPLPPPTLQFADFALWQRQWMEGQTAQRELAYWKRQLRGSPSTLAIATDHPRPPLSSFRGAASRIDISPALGNSLRALSRQQGVTLFMTMFSAFVVLLYRYTQQDDICVGTGVGNRRWKESEELVGMLVNNVVLRTHIASNPKFLDLLAQVRAVTLDAYANEDIPFDQVVRSLEIERDDSRNPIFQVMFSFHDSPLHEPSLPGIRLKCVEVISNQSAKFDLNVIVIPRREQTCAPGAVDNVMTLVWEYNTDLFEAATMERMAGHYFTLLEEIIADPSRRVSDYSLVTEQETQELLRGFHRARSDYPDNKCVHELFEEQVERTPDAIAVVFEEEQITYRELNHRANQLAHSLQKQGVGPEVLVGLCVERSLEMIVGFLGILKAGGAYVPLDPSYPKERLGFMLEDTQAGIVLTDAASLASLPPTGARLICPDRDWEELAREPQDNPISQTTADSLAYVIYTSGSTGVPKGVEVRHRGIVRLLFGVDYVRLDRTQTFLHMAPISFDAATFEVWGALLHGGKCVLFPEKVPSAEDLGKVLKKHRVSTLWLTAALFNTVINEEPQVLSEVKQLLIGGEALSVPHVQKGLALLPETELINGYGPTESTTFTCCYPIPRQLDDNLSSIPIGKPIGNTQVYILDPYLHPVPIGVAGELHIGGDGLARGYLNRPELTEEKFIANPFSDQPGAKLYKTGDLARYLPDGNIEFLGRIDHQVKIRGYRIELGEIEAVLAQYPAIQQSVVLAREDSPGDKRLVAYLVPRHEAVSTINELRSFLQRKLPEYMVPSVFVFMDSLPLTANGKLDRKALPAPEQTRPELDETFAASTTAVEETLANIWSEVLKLDKVGIHDNFFDLGGHSLMATQVVSRIRDAFKVDLALRSLFEAPTIQGLAQKLQDLGNKLDAAKTVQIAPVARDPYRIQSTN